VTFTVEVANNSVSSDPVTLTSLLDDVYGNLNGKGDCSVPQTIAAGDTYSCTFTGPVSGNADDSHTDTVEASAVDNEANPVFPSGAATVAITGVQPAIAVEKTANPTSVPEPGGDVTFTVVVTNSSVSSDPVTLVSLVDDVYGSLDGQGDCSVFQTIAAGDTYSCTFTGPVSGNADDSHTDTVTASGADDEGQAVSASDDATVTVTDVASAIEIIKTADPTSLPEPGGNVTFSFTVNNLSDADSVTINSLSDTIYGDLNGQGDCSVPQTIPAGGFYSCSLTAAVNGNAGDTETNLATASGQDDDGNAVSDDDDAVVTINDVPSAIEIIKTADPISVDEPGGDVTFSFTVNNLSTVDSVTINSLSDTVHGDLNGQGDCSVPQTIPAGGSYSCSINAEVNGNAGDTETNLATASGLDDDGNAVSDDDDAMVEVTDVASAIEIVKTADPTSVDEPGGDVTFSLVVNNLSSVDSVTIDTLTDSEYGGINGGSECPVPQTIAAGDSYSCSFTRAVSGNAGDVVTNTATASGNDDDGNAVSDSDDATVTVADMASAIEIVKTADPTSVDEPGGDVTFSFTVNNLSIVDSVTISGLSDTIHGDLNGQGNCSVPQTIPAGGSYSCSFTTEVTGNAGETETNVVTASGLDDDGNAVSDDSGEVTVTVADVAPAITVDKTAVDTLPAPGGPVTYTVTVTNTSVSSDPVTLTSLTDNVYGDLTDDPSNDEISNSTCALATIVVGTPYSCTFDAGFTGAVDDFVTDTVTANGQDDEGTPVPEATDDHTVTLTP
jgi:hypothetical protein